jgi:hypothetical protein
MFKRFFIRKLLRIQMRENVKKIRKPRLILLGVITVSLLQSCNFPDPDKLYPDFDQNGGMSRFMDELSATQIKEYVETGKFSSTLELNAQCYEGYSVISKENAELTNILAQQGCSDIIVDRSLDKIIILESDDAGKEVVEISCLSTEYAGNELKDKAAEVKLVDNKPTCPIGYRGENVRPWYRRYPYDKLLSERPDFKPFKPLKETLENQQTFQEGQL